MIELSGGPRGRRRKLCNGAEGDWPSDTLRRKVADKFDRHIRRSATDATAGVRSGVTYRVAGRPTEAGLRAVGALAGP